MLLQVADAFYSALSLTGRTLWMQQARQGIRKLAVNWAFCNTLASNKWQMSGVSPKPGLQLPLLYTVHLRGSLTRERGTLKKELMPCLFMGQILSNQKENWLSPHLGRALHSPRASAALTQGYCTSTSSLLAPLNLVGTELGTSVAAETAKLLIV